MPAGTLGLLEGTEALVAIARRQPRLLRDALLELCSAEDATDNDALDRELSRLLSASLGSGTRASAAALEELLRIIVRYRLAIDPQLAGMFRALATLEGTLRVLAPDFDLFQEAQSSASQPGVGLPGVSDVTDDITGDLLELLPMLRRLPRRLDRLSRQAERGELTLKIRLFGDKRDAQHLNRLADRALLAFFSASIGLVSAILLALPAGSPRIVSRLR